MDVRENWYDNEVFDARVIEKHRDVPARVGERAHGEDACIESRENCIKRAQREDLTCVRSRRLKS